MQSSELHSSLQRYIALDYIQRRMTSLGVVCDNKFLHHEGHGLVLASSPGPKRGPGTHCLRMRQSVPRFLVHRIFLCIPALAIADYAYYSADREVYGRRSKHDNREATWPIGLLINIQTVYGNS